MNKSEVGKVGRTSVNKKYSKEIRKEWCRKGAIKLNRILPNKYRVMGGRMQSKEAKSLGAFNSAKKKPLNETEIKVMNILQQAGYSCSINNLSDFEVHTIIKTKLRPFEIDFVKFESNIPKIISDKLQK